VRVVFSNASVVSQCIWFAVWWNHVCISMNLISHIVLLVLFLEYISKIILFSLFIKY
jgi:hypothetical protein